MADQEHSSIGPKHDQAGVDHGSNDEESDPLVYGMSNEDVWRLTRRFNKVCLAG
jgi:hypothetical protein